MYTFTRLNMLWKLLSANNSDTNNCRMLRAASKPNAASSKRGKLVSMYICICIGCTHTAVPFTITAEHGRAISYTQHHAPSTQCHTPYTTVPHTLQPHQYGPYTRGKATYPNSQLEREEYGERRKISHDQGSNPDLRSTASVKADRLTE